MFQLKKLKYNYNDLEPYYDAKTVEIHYTKHHQSYIDNLNNILTNYEEFKSMSLEELLISLEKLPKEIRTGVRNNAGGHFNHTMFWDQFSHAPTKISGKILQLIENDFGSLEKFINLFEEKAKNNFASGWTWLVLNKEKKLEIINTSGHDCPITCNLKPILVIDTWEHAYYLKFQNRRIEWIKSFWNIIDWEYINNLIINN